MIKQKTFFLIFAIFIMNTNSFAKPKCDTAHLDICAREIAQTLIESNAIDAHWENGNYLTGKLVYEHGRGFFVRVLEGKVHWKSDYLTIFGKSDVLTSIKLSIIPNRTVYYFGGTWHNITAPTPVVSTPAITMTPAILVPQAKPMAVPGKTPQAIPNKIPQAKPMAVPTKIVQKTPTPLVVSHTIGTGNKHSKIILSNTHKPLTTINYNKNHKVIVTKNKALKKQSSNQTVSVQVAQLHYKNAKKIDATNVNKHLISTVPGNNLAQNHHAILIDHNNTVWRCKVSGLGHRNMKSQSSKKISLGHAETMHFRNSTFNHISNNISINNNCLISVSK